MEPLEQCLVVHGKRFVQLTEPLITFYRGVVKVNTACLKKLPKTEYVLFLIDPKRYKLFIKPCSEDTLHSMRWRTSSCKPRTLIGHDFISLTMELMQWDGERRYRIPGRAAFDEDGAIIAFDLAAAEEMGGFGPTLEEHKQNPLVSRFAEDTIITLEDRDEQL